MPKYIFYKEHPAEYICMAFRQEKCSEKDCHHAIEHVPHEGCKIGKCSTNSLGIITGCAMGVENV